LISDNIKPSESASVLSPCSICGTEYDAEPCPECAAEIALIARVEEITAPPSIYEDAFWYEEGELL